MPRLVKKIKFRLKVEVEFEVPVESYPEPDRCVEVEKANIENEGSVLQYLCNFSDECIKSYSIEKVGETITRTE